jgi:hypothetical protein
MCIFWEKNYNELPPGVYTACVRKHHWEGYYIFRALPSSGSFCWEFISTDLQQVLDRAEAFSHGVKDDAIYTASF